MNKPQQVSLTGADDLVDVKLLKNISIAYPEVEWAILYYPEREGTARNPTADWRTKFLNTGIRNTAAHLCGQQVFNELLDPNLSKARIADLLPYRRVQVNINARRPDFTPEQVMKVYDRLYAAGITMILQYHEDSAELINNYLFNRMISSRERTSWNQFDILFDGSKGKGVSPEGWPSVLNVGSRDFYCGYAGGLGPDNVEDQVENIQLAAGDKPYWIDMESGIRTDNVFDLDKCVKVLESSTLSFEFDLQP